MDCVTSLLMQLLVVIILSVIDLRIVRAVLETR